MMNQLKRFAALFTAVIILVAYCPVPTGAVTFSEQLETATAGDILQLQQPVTEAVTVDKSVCVDLNGFDITGKLTVLEGCTLYVKDSRTDDYTVEDAWGYGSVAEYNGDVRPCDGYLQVTGLAGISFHRVDMELTSMTLRPDSVGIYYNGCFYGDELVAENVRYFGIALRLQQAPDADYMRTSSSCSRYPDFHAGSQGNDAAGTLLHGVMNTANTAAVNDAQAKLRIWGSAYILTRDGTYLFGAAVGRSFMEQMQAVDAMWHKLTDAQQMAVYEMYDAFYSVIADWYLPNMNDADIDVPI